MLREPSSVVSPTEFTQFDLDLLTVLAHQGASGFENIKLVERLSEAEARARLRTENTYLREVLEREEVSVDIIGDSTALKRTLKQTDVAPAVACAPSTATQSYNCLLAWQDRGIPNARILCTYFRIVNDEVDFYPVTWIRTGAFTVSDLAAAHFEGRYWLAFKTFAAGGDVAWTSTPYWTSWSNVAELGINQVVDAPAWSYSPSDSSERALIWTETMDYESP